MIDRITQANILERELIKAVYDYIEYAEYRQAGSNASTADSTLQKRCRR